MLFYLLLIYSQAKFDKTTIGSKNGYQLIILHPRCHLASFSLILVVIVTFWLIVALLYDADMAVATIHRVWGMGW